MPEAAETNLLREFSSMAAGSAIISISAGIGLISAFKGSVFETYICLIGFILGYRVQQSSLYREISAVDLRSIDLSSRSSIADLAVLAFGTVAMTYSFVFLAQSIVNLDIAGSIGAALLLGAGYMSSHSVINNTLV